LFLNVRTKRKKIDLSPKIKAYLILAFLSIIWGSSYILIKKGVAVYSPYQVAYLRLVVSAFAFLPFLVYIWKKIDWSKWPQYLLVGLTGTALPSLLFPLAQTEVSSSIAGILNSLTPLFTLLLGIIFFNSRFGSNKLVGVLIGLGGAACLILFGNDMGLQGNLWYSLFILLACLCYATSGNVVGHQLKNIPSLNISVVSFTMVGIPAGILLLFTDFPTVLQSHEQGWEALGYIVLLALASTVMASVIFFRLIKMTSPLFSSMVSYLVPAVAVLWGVIDGEPITLMHSAGMGLILFGVYLSRN
jgi:drug/metabolite transporter (DMT)-like permease